MKRVLSAIAFLAIVQTVVTAQTKESSSLSPATTSESAAGRTRVPKAANHADRQRSRTVNTAPQPEPGNSAPLWGNTSVAATGPAASGANPSEIANNSSGGQFVPAPVLTANVPATDMKTGVAAGSAAAAAAASTYDVGVGDVLDIRLSNMPTRESTLFTILKNGTIEYPLLAAPITVAGMTTDQIATILTTQIRVIKAPRINVSVRDYASHAVLISGLVDNAGRQILRREAMPLYAVLAQAAVRTEATTVTVLHNGKEGPPLSLRDEPALSVLIVSGDVIRVSGGVASQFVYVGGNVASPGEKSFREGMTLTQVLLISGANPGIVRVKIARRSGAGLLTTSEFNLRAIEQGKTADPFLEPGDRIEVMRAF